MDVDVRIKNGVVHTPSGAVEADLLVRGEKIFGIVSRDEETRAALEIDATGKHVVPGLIDPHAHTRVPGYEYKEDYVTSSQAAAVGGITAYVDMPNVEPPTDSVTTYEQKRRIAEEACLIDWGHFVSGTKLDQIKPCAEAGATGYKIFQVSGGYPHDPRLAMGESERIYAAFDAIAPTGLPCLVHPYNQPLMDLMSERALAAGRPRDPAAAVGQGHAAADLVEEAVQAALPHSDVVVHVEPHEAEGLRERAQAAALSVPRVREVHNITVLEIEGRMEVSLHLKLPGELSLVEAHEIAEEVERAICAALPEVESVQTHLEPLAESAHVKTAENVGAVRVAAQRIVREVLGTEPRELRFLQTSEGLVAFLTLGLDASASLAEAHARASEVKMRIREERPEIADVIVHTEP